MPPHLSSWCGNCLCLISEQNLKKGVFFFAGVLPQMLCNVSMLAESTLALFPTAFVRPVCWRSTPMLCACCLTQWSCSSVTVVNLVLQSFQHIARNFGHLRDCAWPSWAAYANPRLIADAGRRSVVRGSNAVVDREEKKKISSLSGTILSLKAFLVHLFPLTPPPPFSRLPLFLSVGRIEAISLSLPDVRQVSLSGTHSLSDSLLSSSIFFSCHSF